MKQREDVRKEFEEASLEEIAEEECINFEDIHIE